MGDLKDHDARFRAAAFAHLESLCAKHGDVLASRVLRDGFRFEGQSFPIIAPQQGIYKPKHLEWALSFRTAPALPGRPAPYADGLDQAGLLTYRYQGTNPDAYDNVAMRGAMLARAPLIYFYGIDKGQYLPVWPVYVVSDDREDLAFKVAVDDRVALGMPLVDADRVAEGRRSYVTTLTTRRLHQATFRQRVLRAYAQRCAICQLRRTELLEAAHILPDRHPLGEPVVSNGLALCNLHHAAFDHYIIGVRPDFIIEVRQDILEEVDGPMLKHGLQEINETRIHVPREKSQQPDRDHLDERYRLFRQAG